MTGDRGERCRACWRPTYAGEDFGGPCVDESDLACALRERDDARAEVERLNTDVRILEKSNDAKFEQWRSAERDLACAKEALAELRAKFEAP